jgi:hypothetical protein
LEEDEMPRFFEDLIVRMGPLPDLKDAASRENLRKAGLLND